MHDNQPVRFELVHEFFPIAAIDEERAGVSQCHFGGKTS